MRTIAAAVNIHDLRTLAKRRLPSMVFDALDGGADDERTIRANEVAFERLTLRPRPLSDISVRDLSTTVFGQAISMPVMLAPVGSARLIRPQAELEIVQAAGAERVIYTQSTVASYSPEKVAAAAQIAPWFQLYLPPDREVARQLVRRVQAAGYAALVLTLDMPIRGNRERDLRNHFSVPYRMSPRLVAQFLSRPLWSAQYLQHNARRSRADREADNHKPHHGYPAGIGSASPAWPVTWDDVEFVRGVWQGPLLVKGLVRDDQCDELISRGVDGIVVSNHGGRQLDGVSPTIEALDSVVQACTGRIEIYLDGGIRRGTDVVKALALGARACFIGRPYLYGFAAGGTEGVVRALEILRVETDRSMALLGCASVSNIDKSVIVEAR